MWRSPMCRNGSPRRARDDGVPSLALGHTDSGGEQVHRWLPGANVVKAFNIISAHAMVHPQFPGGPPTPPYDNAGWTLAYQMGVKFDRILDGFEGPFEKVNGFAKPLPSKTAMAGNIACYLLSHETNDSFIATNRLLKDGEEVYWLKQPLTVGGVTHPAGTIYIPAKSSTAARVQKLSADLGLRFAAMTTKPNVGEMLKLRQPRIALWDRYGGSMPSGWTRWILEQFDFPFTVVYPQTLDAGNLADKFDVIIFVTQAIPGVRAGGGGAATSSDEPPQFGRAPQAAELPEKCSGF